MRFIYAYFGVFIMWMLMCAMSGEAELATMSADTFWLITAIVAAGGLAGGK